MTEHQTMLSGNDMYEFLEKNNILNGRIVREAIYKIIRTKDNHLLFVLGKPIDDIPIKELIKITPFYSSSVSNKDGVLNYDVIKVGGSND